MKKEALQLSSQDDNILGDPMCNTFFFTGIFLAIFGNHKANNKGETLHVSVFCLFN